MVERMAMRQISRLDVNVNEGHAALAEPHGEGAAGGRGGLWNGGDQSEVAARPPLPCKTLLTLKLSAQLTGSHYTAGPDLSPLRCLYY